MNLVEEASELLLAPAHLNAHNLEKILGQTLSRQVDMADLYIQASHHESWLLEENIVKECSLDIDRGFGLRVISGEKTGFAYADEISLAALTTAAGSAKSIVQAGQSRQIALQPNRAPHQLYPAINPLNSWTELAKVDLLKRVDAHAHRLDPRVKRVTVRLHSSYDVFLVMNTDGVWQADMRPMVGLRVSVVVEENGRRESGTYGCGVRAGYEWFNDEATVLRCAEKAVRQAIINLSAISAPAGMMPVVLGPGWPAVLLHEAIGHGLEADHIRKDSSVFAGKMGESVASSLCTVVDDGTVPQRRGSLNIDDEGVPTQKTVLIENGILKNYLQDRHNAKLMNMSPTGNGRRESYAHLPLPRMTNTYLLPGESDPAEIIASVDRGIYAVDFSGGQVDTTSGQFVFSSSEAYLIENGKITAPVKGATLIGSGIEVLKKISMVGNDLALDDGIGSCGKGGQTVAVGVGQPTLKVSSLTVGGTQK